MRFDLEILRIAQGLSAHASARQRLISENIANADTPDYNARDLRSFSELYQSGVSRPLLAKTTRMDHAGYSTDQPRAEQIVTSRFNAANPNGNSVALEDQMMRGAEVKYQHELALSVFTKSLKILRLGLGKTN
jgi:flagellar basal-body rod protein FlgB